MGNGRFFGEGHCPLRTLGSEKLVHAPTIVLQNSKIRDVYSVIFDLSCPGDMASLIELKPYQFVNGRRSSQVQTK